MAKKYKILITGIAGFLGSHLSEKLIDLGHTIVGIDNMVGGYQDNIPKNVEFYNIDCCDFSKIKNACDNSARNCDNSFLVRYFFTFLLFNKFSAYRVFLLLMALLNLIELE